MWNDVSVPPPDQDVLVLYDHDQDPYEIEGTNRLTNYASWAEGGDYLQGRGIAIAKLFPAEWITEGHGPEAIQYSMPSVWRASFNGEYEYVCNVIKWCLLPAVEAEESHTQSLGGLFREFADNQHPMANQELEAIYKDIDRIYED